MIRHLILTAALIPAAQAVATHCDPPTERVVANCAAPDGTPFGYDGSRAGMPAGCIVIGTGDAGPSSTPVEQAQTGPETADTAPSVPIEAGDGLQGRAAPQDAAPARPGVDTRTLDCAVEDGHHVRLNASSRPAADVATDLADGRCTVVPAP